MIFIANTKFILQYRVFIKFLNLHTKRQNIRHFAWISIWLS